MPHPATEQISYGDLVVLLTRIFCAAGLGPDPSRILAENCAGCERDGAISHGVFRIPGYLAALRSGWADGNAVPVIEDDGGSLIRVDVRNGFAQCGLASARALFLDRARQHGIAALALRNSHHFSALWPDVEPMAGDGFVALSFVPGLACVAPPGSGKSVLGTNPIAFASPVDGAEPFVFDMATSALSNGDVRIAARESRSLEAGCGVDRYGQPTVDPDAILQGGALLAFGGYKGAAISTMIEILGGALTGGQFSSEVDYAGYEGAEIPKTGQLIIAMNPDFAGSSGFGAHVKSLLHRLRDAGWNRLPGDARLITRSRAGTHGIAIPVETLTELQRLAALNRETFGAQYARTTRD